ncbi:hypothetical protein B1756_06545 [Natrarchaeobaculum aegyptiacum]|uniref:Uncharacterized protein n=1 Tax=Natrarchaeobaculum aegyptiacum TaxID=745377 RepID=A0A2Z2HZ41_9EURY|nr:hypothetical protein B1756_06545 [Natrarchaeobaculum aegyptiacum]
MTRSNKTTEVNGSQPIEQDSPDASLSARGGTDGVEDAGAPLTPMSLSGDTVTGPRITETPATNQSRDRTLEAEQEAPLVPDLRPLERDRRSQPMD